jgi:hypothetical protein
MLFSNRASALIKLGTGLTFGDALHNADAALAWNARNWKAMLWRIEALQVGITPILMASLQGALCLPVASGGPPYLSLRRRPSTCGAFVVVSVRFFPAVCVH